MAAALDNDPDAINSLQSIAAGKQDELTAGANIDITGVTISVTGLDTDDVAEGTRLYFTDQRAIDAVGGTATSESTANTVVKRDSNGDFAAHDITVSEISIGEIGRIYDDGDLIIENIDGMDVQINAEDIRLNSTDDIRLNATGDVVIGSTTGHIRFEDGPVHIGFPVTAENEVATKEYVTGAISAIDLTFNSDEVTEGSTNLYFQDSRAVDALEAVVPNFTAVELNSVAKQVAAKLEVATSGIQVAYAWNKSEYRSAEFLVKVETETHSEISKVLLTLAGNDNISITEYGIVGTNGSMSSISAVISGTDVQLQVTTTNNNSVVTVMGTLLN